MKRLFTMWIIDHRSAIKNLMLCINNKTGTIFVPRISLYFTSQNRNSFSCFTIFIQLNVYILKLLSASQDWERLSSNMCPCTQWKLYLHNEELKPKFDVFYHIPSLLALRILQLFQINSFYFSRVQNLIHSTSCISAFLLPFPVLNFHSTKLINKLQELGNMKQYLQNLFFTNLSVSLHLGLLSRVCAHLWEYKMCHILSTDTVIKQYFIVWKKHAWHSDANILTSSML